MTTSRPNAISCIAFTIDTQMTLFLYFLSKKVIFIHDQILYPEEQARSTQTSSFYNIHDIGNALEINNRSCNSLLM